MTSGQIDYAELLRLAISNELADVHVSMPGRVVSYDAARQTANVQPVIKRLVPSASDEDGFVTESLPVIPSVPVQCIRGAGFFLHIPLVPGDVVLLIFGESDPSVFLSTGEDAAPADHRRHSLAHAWAVPGFAAASRAIAGLSAANLTLGKEGGLQIVMTPAALEVGGATDAAARASLVLSELQALRATYNTHTHVETGGTTNTALPQASAPTSVASVVLKVGS